MTTATKKITRTTIKQFIKRELAAGNLWIKVRSKFDGMYDGVNEVDSSTYLQVKEDTFNKENTLGIQGAWFVGSSRDYFYPHEENEFIGYKVINCCGSFVLAMRIAR